jgi:hypothetical protein
MVTHPVVLRGAGESGIAPVILHRTDQDVIGSLLAELGDGGGLASVRATQAKTRARDGVLRLFQPVHRVFHIVLIDAACDTVGQPRLDPARIESAGLVLRRHGVDATGVLQRDVLEGWMAEAPTARSRENGASKKRGVRGWTTFAGRLAEHRTDLDRDPDPAKRRPERSAGHVEIDRQLALRGPAEALTERVIPLFVAPPEICAATGRTLLYGLVPLTSTEQAEAPEPVPPYDTTDLTNHLPQLVRSGLTASIPRAGGYLRHADVAIPEPPSDIARFVMQLRQFATEMDLFGSGVASRALRREMDEIELEVLDEAYWPEHRTTEGVNAYHLARAMRHPVEGIVRRSMTAFLMDAIAVLISGERADGAVRMPVVWPQIPTGRATRIRAAAGRAMQERITTIVPRRGRFDERTREYRVRAFVRLREQDDCPPRLVWSGYSEVFTIAPWYAPSDAPPTVIPLPDALNLAALKALKPNVAFAVPRSLMDFMLGNDAKKLVDGEGGKGGGGIALDWICSFSLPIITLCAFICLNIFLSLFDLIFSWMMYIKVCIPIPRKT